MWQVEWTFINELRTRNKGQSGSHAWLLTLRSHAAPEVEVLAQPAHSAEVQQKTCRRPRWRVELSSGKPYSEPPLCFMKGCLSLCWIVMVTLKGTDYGPEVHPAAQRLLSASLNLLLFGLPPHVITPRCSRQNCSHAVPADRAGGFCSFCSFNQMNQYFLKAATLYKSKLPSF